MRARLFLVAVPAAFLPAPPPAVADALCVVVALATDQTAREAAPECVPYGGVTKCRTQIVHGPLGAEVRVVACVPN